MAARFPTSPRVGYGTTIPAMARMLRPWPIASVQVVISSPACGADDGGAEDPALAVGDDLDVAAGLALGLGAVVLVERPAQHPDAPCGAARLVLGEADMGELGVGEGHARDQVVVGLRRQPEQRVPDDKAGVIVGGVGELRPAGDVADGVDAAVGGAQAAGRPRCPRGRVRDAGRARDRARRRWRAGRPRPGDGCRRCLARRPRLPSTTATPASPPRRARPRRRRERRRPRARAGRARCARIRASSRASGCAASSTVTAAPSRRNACASSSPIGPAPMTMRCSRTVR